MAYFDLSKLNLAYTNVMKAFKSKMQWCRGVTVALRTTCVKNVKFKIIKKDRLSVFEIISPQRKPQLGRTKLLTGPQVGHSWLKQCCSQSTRKSTSTISRILLSCKLIV